MVRNLSYNFLLSLLWGWIRNFFQKPLFNETLRYVYQACALKNKGKQTAFCAFYYCRNNYSVIIHVQIWAVIPILEQEYLRHVCHLTFQEMIDFCIYPTNRFVLDIWNSNRICKFCCKIENAITNVYFLSFIHMPIYIYIVLYHFEYKYVSMLNVV